VKYTTKAIAVPLHATEALEGRGSIACTHSRPWYSFSTLVLDGGEWSASRFGRALDPGKGPGTHCTGGWVDPRAGVGAETRGKFLSPLSGIEPRLL
jgi:hypothetical protein